MVVGGEGKFDVELYSPEGKCQHVLAKVPGRMTEFWRPVLAYLGGKIMACHGSENNVYCWEYETSKNTWSVLTNSKTNHNHFPGKSHFNDMLNNNSISLKNASFYLNIVLFCFALQG